MIKAYATSMMLRITPTASNNVIHREKSKKWWGVKPFYGLDIVVIGQCVIAHGIIPHAAWILGEVCF